MLAKRLRICAVTGSRSEYGLLRWLMQDLVDDPQVDFKLAVTGAHWSDQFGRTYREIEKDGFVIDAKIQAPLDTRSGVSLAKAVGTWTAEFAQSLERIRPDVVLVMGDRYELLSVSAACALLSIPLAHISGGEITEGAVDEQIRHAVTKMAHLHFVANSDSAGIVRQMGEEPWRICISGDPGLDYLRRLTLLSREELEKTLKLDLSKPTALVTFHPVTLEAERRSEQITHLLSALEKAPLQYVVTYPNADLGSGEIIARLRSFAARYSNRVRLVEHLGQTRYLSLLRWVHLMVGNSSSGLVEAPCFRLPVVNVGDRQKGRMRGENVLDCACTRDAIGQTIRKALAYDRSLSCRNPYGDGHSSRRIRAFLHKIFARYSKEAILKKRFVVLSETKR